MKRIYISAIIALSVFMTITVCASAEECTYYAQNGVHNWNQADVGLPSCTEDGFYILKCNECGLTQREITGGAYGHSWEKTKVLEATCTDKGYIEYTCNECGEQEIEDVMPYGHVWQKVGEVAGTCVHPSYIHYSCCNGCGDTKTETINAPGHTWKDLYEIQPATCTFAGSMKAECRVCGEVGTRIIEIIDHNYDEWIVTKAVDNAMCVRIRSCIMCGKQEAEEFYPEGTLYRGVNARQAVKDLQNMLSDCGYLNDTIDGVFGKKTEQAIQAFQRDAGIGADGIAWPQTIVRLTAKWEALMGITATPTPVVVPMPEATEEPVLEPERLFCASFENADGVEEVVYCEGHQVMVEMCNAFMNAAKTSESRAKALNQCRNLWKEEVNLLYEKWALIAEDEDKATIENGKAMFDAYLASQEALWNMQYKKSPDLVLEKINELLIDQCVSLCGIVGETDAEQITTEKGVVSVELVDGWYVGEPIGNASITLYNDAVGPSDTTWLTITDNQTGNGIGQAKQVAMFAYVGRQFSEVQIGENIFQYIATQDGMVFTLIAETSTGKAMKVDGRNCTLEQAMTLLETVVIH